MPNTAKKVTPYELGQNKIKIDLPSASYSHESQISGIDGNVIYMTTFNATQTFDTRGNHNDRDNDK